MKLSKNVIYFLFALIVISVGSYISVNLDGPYMDEMFHIQQSQVFCAGNLVYLSC